MRSRRVWEWAVVGLLVGALLAAGFSGVVFHAQAFAALGLSREGAPTSLPAGALEPPKQTDPDDQTEPPAPGTGLVGGAAVAEGPKPDPKALGRKLQALDRKKLKGLDGAPVTVAYEVVDPATGKVVASSKADKPLIPASNTKTLTAIAVLSAFDGSERFATRVLQPEPGRIVLVGGGDPLLRSVPDKARPYPRPATTEELAAATAKVLLAAGQKKVTLGFNAGYFSEPGWNETWPGMYRDQVTQLSALWVDEGRLAEGGRSREPAVDAAKTFAAQLKKHGVTVKKGEPKKAAAKGEEIARVESLPVHVLMETAMNRSNNSFTEIMGLQLAVHTGHPSTFAGAVAAIEEQLKPLDLWDKGTVLHDSSGLSRQNRVTAGMLARAVALSEQDQRLSVLLDGLPTAGVTGTLADRFTDPIAEPARGVARAKTGTLSLVSTLAGTTATADGRLLSFAFMINGPPDGWAAKVWADQATGVVASCGC
ncbi:MAG: D-alanyl-D-alanine carboxypeptidase/D-alanyl-D-alanine-endopeptidase [Tessaracoccus sp.]|uniref:D-alanyl-D-alanine carboxypeptidase/D-alanyl-D-alanine endopeptidase n=1 Tax=Tessaracoccus sp. TaxID=1971211 RepID=UPI001EBC8ADA|nr:D-alanyl-D-alanine carboxypeptidase/D-alanyl-D-alanine-endopeptidase [Tessaracoccus sp.]MBK7822588.1 D-alanyl-D-alanine carboxypeptidase/D-alanyl-D-alanine-endopeptidase [Tessaracoccus sp.]